MIAPREGLSNNTGQLVLYLYDISGRTLAQQSIRYNEKMKLDVQSYTPGMYLYEVKDGDTTLHRGKVIIEKQ